MSIMKNNSNKMSFIPPPFDRLTDDDIRTIGSFLPEDIRYRGVNRRIRNAMNQQSQVRNYRIGDYSDMEDLILSGDPYQVLNYLQSIDDQYTLIEEIETVAKSADFHGKKSIIYMLCQYYPQYIDNILAQLEDVDTIKELIDRKLVNVQDVEHNVKNFIKGDFDEKYPDIIDYVSISDRIEHDHIDADFNNPYFNEDYFDDYPDYY